MYTDIFLPAKILYNNFCVEMRHRSTASLLESVSINGLIQYLNDQMTLSMFYDKVKETMLRTSHPNFSFTSRIDW